MKQGSYIMANFGDRHFEQLPYSLRLRSLYAKRGIIWHLENVKVESGGLRICELRKTRFEAPTLDFEPQTLLGFRGSGFRV